jgi:hypothetical protein
MCPRWRKSSRELQGMYGLQGSSEENLPTPHPKIYTPPTQPQQTVNTQPGVTLAQTTETFYTPHK